jgi:hypothetical protein
MFKDFFDTNDLTISMSDNGYDDELLEYMLKNKIDILISLNLCHNSFKQSLKRTNCVSYTETYLPLQNESELLNNKAIVFKKQNIYFQMKLAETASLADCSFTHLLIDKIDLKRTSSCLSGTNEYSKETLTKLNSILLAISSNFNLENKKIMLLCK